MAAWTPALTAAGVGVIAAWADGDGHRLRRPALALIGCQALQALSGHPATVLHALLVFWIVMLGCALRLRRRGASPRRQRRRALAALPVVLALQGCGFLLAAPQPLPFAEYLTRSDRLASRMAYPENPYGIPLHAAWTDLRPAALGDRIEGGFASLCLGSAAVKSITTDETVHLAAGYAYLATGQFRMNTEHPPLAKAVAAVPLFLLRLPDPESMPAWSLGNDAESAYASPVPREVALKSVRLDGFLANSAAVAQGEAVGSLILTLGNGETAASPVRAGIEVAEWAARRPDVSGSLRHSPAAVAGTFAVPDSGSDFAGLEYRGEWSLPPEPIRALEAVLNPPPCCPDLIWIIKRGSMVLRASEPGSASAPP